MYFDQYYLLLVIPAVLFSLWAQYRVNSTFSRYNGVRLNRDCTAAQAARMILDRSGLQQVRIEQVAGNLTDHYDPKANVIRLSAGVHGASTVGALGVAAHEAGHAMQYANGYFPIRIRSALIPITNIGSTIAIPLAIIGIAMGSDLLSGIGILLFLAVVLFQLVTLPVEFNASRRAMNQLAETGLLTREEQQGAKKVLTAAALTYVAALVVALANLLRLIMLRNRRR